MIKHWEPHTEEFNAAVAEMWNRGDSSGYIASRLKVTRNAVIGVVHRLKGRGVEMRDGTVILPHSRKRREPKHTPGMPAIPEERKE